MSLESALLRPVDSTAFVVVLAAIGCYFMHSYVAPLLLLYEPWFFAAVFPVYTTVQCVGLLLEQRKKLREELERIAKEEAGEDCWDNDEGVVCEEISPNWTWAEEGGRSF